MNKQSFTPGPWYQSGQAFDGEQHFIDICNGANGNTLATLTGYSPAEARANSHLIAAAPELYEALAELVRVDDDWHGSVNSEMAAARAKARGALAKAVTP